MALFAIHVRTAERTETSNALFEPPWQADGTSRSKFNISSSWLIKIWWNAVPNGQKRSPQKSRFFRSGKIPQKRSTGELQKVKTPPFIWKALRGKARVQLVSIYIKMSCKNGFVRDSRLNHWTDSDERCTVRTALMCRSVYSVRNLAAGVNKTYWRK